MAQLADGGDLQHDDGDEQISDDDDPLKHLRIVNGDENTGTSNLVRSELISGILPGQHYSLQDKTLTLTFSKQGSDQAGNAGPDYDQLSIILAVDASPGCGGVVWPAGQILSSYLFRKGPEYLRGKNVVELGSGTGLVGLIAAMLDAGQVWVTDQAPLLEIMRKNVYMNCLTSKCTVAELDWGTPAPTMISKPDMILAADCVYFEPAFPLLVQTLCDLVGEKTEVLFCYKKRRKADRRFFALLKKKFDWQEV
ncbi:Protein-lysine N-methyltransferase efm6 [Paramarasmius palmivorus]|uniref:Protein-lysine N-methyltransferase EFM6 n=1 Tax=Paramarasmius palmivorus TaxID=297713 RepID=A0AAW0E7T9_9AGAR